MIFAYLVLAHLLGDFVLQPSKLVQWKMKSVWGVFTHVMVHFSLLCILLAPFIYTGGYKLIFVILFISTTHFIIDQSKISYDLRHDKKVKPFIIDQLLHLLMLILGFSFVSNYTAVLPAGELFSYYGDLKIIGFITLMVFVTEVVEIYYYQKAREKNSGAPFRIHYKNMGKRILVFSAIYIVFIFLLFYTFGESYKFL